MTTTGEGQMTFFVNPDGVLFVDVADLVVWCLGFAQGLKADGREDAANAVAGVGNVLAAVLAEQTPDPEAT